MFLIKLFNIFKGYVIIKIYGVFSERFLNICTFRNIKIWNVRRLSKNEMTACVCAEDFKKLKPAAKKSMCSVHIVGRHGLPFFLQRHRKRKALAIGAAVILVLGFVSTRFIWMTKITGNSIIPTERLTAELEKYGVKSGAPISKIDIGIIRNRLVTDIPEISWAEFNIKGTTAVLEIKERRQIPEKFDRNAPCSLAASNDGVIVRADVTEGEKLVLPGDVVTKGQLLVSGLVKSENTSRYVHSDGEITARTWHEKTVDLPLYKEIKTPTGAHKSKHSLSIFNFYIKFYLNDRISYKNYDRISYVKNFSLFGGYALPVAFHYDNYTEQNVRKAEMTPNEAVLSVQKELDAETKNAEIVKKSHKISGNKLTVTYECIENIAEKVGFEFDSRENNQSTEH